MSSWRDARSIRALIFTFSFTSKKFWRLTHVMIQGNVTFWIRVFERFEVVIAYFALVNLGWFSKHFISFQKLPTVIFRSHCSTVVYKWNWTMYVYVCVSVMGQYLFVFTWGEADNKPARKYLWNPLFSKYISKMWEEDDLNFLEKMLSTSQLCPSSLQRWSLFLLVGFTDPYNHT